MNKRLLLVTLMTLCIVLMAVISFAAQIGKGEKLHVIKWGDTLSRIASEYHTPMKAIQERNKIKNPDRIYADRTLIIPVAQKEKVKIVETVSPSMATQFLVDNQFIARETETIAPPSEETIHLNKEDEEVADDGTVTARENEQSESPYAIALTAQPKQVQKYIDINGSLVPIPIPPPENLPREVSPVLPPLMPRDHGAIPQEPPPPPEIPPGNVIPKRQNNNDDNHGLIILSVYIPKRIIWISNITNFRKSDDYIKEVEK